MKAHGGMDSRVHRFAATALGRIGWLAVRSAFFTPGRAPVFILQEGLVGPRANLNPNEWREEK